MVLAHCEMTKYPNNSQVHTFQHEIQNVIGTISELNTVMKIRMFVTVLLLTFTWLPTALIKDLLSYKTEVIAYKLFGWLKTWKYPKKLLKISQGEPLSYFWMINIYGYLHVLTVPLNMAQDLIHLIYQIPFS